MWVFIPFACLLLGNSVVADLRFGTGAASSHPRAKFRGCPGSYGKKCHSKYIIPSIFVYNGLKYPGGQKYNNYDQFLRSNIDNEQDNRNFEVNAGQDHLPFRSMYRGASYDLTAANSFVEESYSCNRYDGAVCGTTDLRATVAPGDSMLVPLRWNNPHASELEVNIWIFDYDGNQPIAVPIRKPTCSGEGYQNNVVKFTVPKDFAQLGGKIPGFKGCKETGRGRNQKPMCVLQIYSHSVESRQYAYGFPIHIPGHVQGMTTSSYAGIQAVSKDPWYDLAQMRDLCLPNTDLSADIPNAVPRWARLVSDVYTHSYMNSDFSPYSGQQQESISKNLQTSAINKMVTGNRGELGASILTAEAYQRIRQLQTLEDRIYKNYESIANKVIRSVGNQMKNTGSIEADANSKAKLAICFRCAEVGSVGGARLETNTYIPSFKLPQSLVATARQVVPSRYSELISQSGQVRIYEQSTMDLMPFFFVSQAYGIVYQEAKLKKATSLHESIAPHADVTKFRKLDADGKTDQGVYASTMAKQAFAAEMGCPKKCLYCETNGFKPIIRGSRATCISGDCASCVKLFNDYHKTAPPKVTSLGKEIVKNGLPSGMGSGGIPTYPDPDGSPRIGRPTQRPGEAPFPTVTPPSWDFGQSTTPGPVWPTPSSTPWPTPSTTPNWPVPSPTPDGPPSEVVDWKIPMEPQMITVKAGTEVMFKWSGYHNLAKTSKSNFDSCGKNGNEELAPGSNGGEKKVVEAMPGTYYYICEVGGHCSFGQKIAITWEAPTVPLPPSKVVDWKIPVEPQMITVKAGTEVTFKWSGYHNLAKASKSNFDSCDRGNEELAPGSNGGEKKVVEETPGTYYYICEVGSHCRFGQKIAITWEEEGAPTTPAPTVPTTPAPTVPPVARRRRRGGSSRRRRRRGSTRRRSTRRRSSRRRRRGSSTRRRSKKVALIEPQDELTSLLLEVEPLIQSQS